MGNKGRPICPPTVMAWLGTRLPTALGRLEVPLNLNLASKER